MNDVELESLISEAGYQFDPATGQYIDTSDEETVYDSEQVADQLEIPLEDLQRWEEQQQVEKPQDT